MSPYEKLKKLCTQTPPSSKILIVCPDNVRKNRALEYALNTLCPKSNSIAVQKYEASALTPESVRELRDSSLTLSLFSTQKFIVIKNVDKALANSAKDLELLLNSKNISNTFICSATSISQRTTVAKAFEQDSLVELPKLEGEEIIKWTAQELKRQGAQETEAKVVRIIASMGSEDPDQIAALVEKIVLYCDGQQVSMADVQALETFKEKVQEFNFINLLASNKKTAAYAYVEQLNNSDTNIFPLIGLISKMFSNYLRLKVGKNSMKSDSEISKDLGLSPWAFKKQAEIAAGCKEVKLIRMLKATMRADSQIKNKNLGESAILTELISNAS